MTEERVPFHRAGRGPTLVLPLLLLAGCWQGTPSTAPTAAPVGDFELLAQLGSRIITREKPIVVDLIARNLTDQRVQWGIGSSTCQLDLYVHVGNEERIAILSRPCTTDIGVQLLESGESRIEARLPWDGTIDDGHGYSRLPAGHYQVWPAAGALRGEKPLDIEVRN